jgi:hypothetical protein
MTSGFNTFSFDNILYKVKAKEPLARKWNLHKTSEYPTYGEGQHMDNRVKIKTDTVKKKRGKVAQHQWKI